MKGLAFMREAARGSLLLIPILTCGVATAAIAADPDPDRYIVSFLDVGKGKAALRAAGASVQLELDRYEAAAAHIPPQALKGLRNNPHIEYIEEDVLRYPLAQTMPWGIPAVQADLVSDSAAGNRTVCIIDSGYALGHEDLPTANVTGEAGTDWDVDNCHHGTHVAGTIAALDDRSQNDDGIGVLGVLPSGNLNLHIVKVFGDSCAWSYSSSLVAALDECESASANVVSMSLGGGFKSRTEERAFAQAYNRGVLSVAAAGNDGNTRKSYPASYDSVISVAAVDSAGEVADFSQKNDQVELAGPGVAVRSTVGMGDGLEESLAIGGITYEVTAMAGSAKGSVTGNLFRCQGVGEPGDCVGAIGQICVIMRGNITFAEKVQECESRGGVGAVIVNNGPALFSGTLGNVVTSIPSVGIAGDDAGNLVPEAEATVTVQGGNYAFYDGTSMATPHVSGVAALVWSQVPDCSNAELRSALAEAAYDLGPAGRDTAYGYGLVQADVQADDAAAAIISGCGSSGGGGGGGGENPPPPGCDGGQIGSSCDADSDCCSGTCKGKPGSKSCK